MVLLQVLESCSQDVGWAAPPEGSTRAGWLASKKAHVAAGRRPRAPVWASPWAAPVSPCGSCFPQSM